MIFMHSYSYSDYNAEQEK